MLLSPNIKPGNKPRTAELYCPFPWEKKSDEELAKKAEQYRVTQDEVEELNKIFAEIENNTR